PKLPPPDSERPPLPLPAHLTDTGPEALFPWPRFDSWPYHLEKRPGPVDRVLLSNPLVREYGRHHLFHILPAVQAPAPQITQPDKQRKNLRFPEADNKINDSQNQSETRARDSAAVRLKQLLPRDKVQEGSPP